MTARMPQREKFSRRDVERLTRLGGRVLDYWEKEFGNLAPITGISGEKIYSRRDVETLIQIKHWLIEERLGKDEVRRRLEHPVAVDSGEAPPQKPRPQPLNEVRTRLREILTILDKSDTN
ncbi:MAG TPA: MerR family transcriptional regulator [Candidatus Aminicenantes bacterium]|nr:MerR family transcriptional regulator [Candidatus Aminicenantes bacterium]